VAVVEQPVEQCRGERGVWEDVAPMAEALVARILKPTLRPTAEKPFVASRRRRERGPTSFATLADAEGERTEKAGDHRAHSEYFARLAEKVRDVRA